MGEKGTIVSKQQLNDEFLDGFRACEEMSRVERLPSVRKRMQMPSDRSSFASRSMMLKKMGARTHPCLTLLRLDFDIPSTARGHLRINVKR